LLDLMRPCSCKPCTACRHEVLHEQHALNNNILNSVFVQYNQRTEHALQMRPPSALVTSCPSVSWLACTATAAIALLQHCYWPCASVCLAASCTLGCSFFYYFPRWRAAQSACPGNRQVSESPVQCLLGCRKQGRRCGARLSQARRKVWCTNLLSLCGPVRRRSASCRRRATAAEVTLTRQCHAGGSDCRMRRFCSNCRSTCRGPRCLAVRSEPSACGCLGRWLQTFVALRRPRVHRCSTHSSQHGRH